MSVLKRGLDRAILKGLLECGKGAAAVWSENKVRIIDIAQELGLSTATVSNVLHGKTKKISAQTVRRVQEKLEQRGYIPNMAATLLGQNDSRIIGVVIKNHEKYEGQLLTDPFIASALNDISDEIEGNGFFMMVKKATDIREAVKFASMWNMVGMLILSFCSDEYQSLRDQIRIPFVVYDGYLERTDRFCNIRIDDRDGGRQVGAHLRSWATAGSFALPTTCTVWTGSAMRAYVRGWAFGRTF